MPPSENTVLKVTEESERWSAWWKQGRPGAFTFDAFVAAVDHWTASGLHSGAAVSESLSKFNALNAVRMRRVQKTLKWPEKLAAYLDGGHISGQHWVCITESWCGDAAHTLPLIAAMAERGKVALDIVLRDQENGLIEDFLSGGSRSIPKWIIADQGGHVLGVWGPRPGPLQEWVQANKLLDHPLTKQELAVQIQLWYARDRGRHFFDEATSLLRDCEALR